MDVRADDGRLSVEAAWDAVHEALPARWRVPAPPSIADPLTRNWSITAVGPYPGRGKSPQSVTGRGPTEVDALRDLDDQLRGVDHTKGTRLEELRQRLRQAYVEGAEGWARENLGRGLTDSELTGVLQRYRGSL